MLIIFFIISGYMFFRDVIHFNCIKNLKKKCSVLHVGHFFGVSNGFQ